jgi:hypothetical protein
VLIVHALHVLLPLRRHVGCVSIVHALRVFLPLRRHVKGVHLLCMHLMVGAC